MDLELTFQENKTNVLIIEEQKTYTDFLNRIMQQQSGIDCGMSVYEEDRKINFSKEIMLIHSPLLIELNNKRVQNFLYNELQITTNEFLYDTKEKLNSSIVEYLDLLANKMPYPIKYDLDLDMNLLYKHYNVGFNYDEKTLLEKVLNFIQLEKVLCNTKMIIFVNLKAFFAREQIMEIYRQAFYNKIQLLLVESIESYCLTEEKYYIIDKDKCLIVYE